jgi:phage baseplate assembly protein gpV
MALNFPNEPTLNESFSSGGVTYIWDGVKWTSKGATTGLPVVPDENGNVVITGTLTVNGASITGNSITVSDISATSADLSGDLTAANADLAGDLNVAGDIDND